MNLNSKIRVISMAVIVSGGLAIGGLSSNVAYAAGCGKQVCRPLTFCPSLSQAARNAVCQSIIPAGCTSVASSACWGTQCALPGNNYVLCLYQ